MSHELASLDKKPEPDSTEKKWPRIVIPTIAVLATAGLLLGPNIRQAYRDAHDIETKRGPAEAYVHHVLGVAALGHETIAVNFKENTCSNGPRFSPGDYSRTCLVRGDATYVLHTGLSASEEGDRAADQLAAAGIYDKKNLDSKSRMALQDMTYENQTFPVAVGVTSYTADAYNHRFPYPTDEKPVDAGVVVLVVNAEAYTVDHQAPDYPYNKEN
jgi:hypothetical protein